MRLTTILIILFSFTVTSPAAEMYKWRDENGNLHFSDQPVTGQKVEKFTPPAINSTQSDSKSKKKNFGSAKARTKKYLRGVENDRRWAAARKRQENMRKAEEERIKRARIDKMLEKRRKRNDRLRWQRGY